MADNNPLRRKTRSMRTDSPLKEYVPPKRTRRAKQTTTAATTTAPATATTTTTTTAAATATDDRTAVLAQYLSPVDGTLPPPEAEENAVIVDECEKKRFQPVDAATQTGVSSFPPSPSPTSSSPAQSPARSPQFSPSGTVEARFDGQIVVLTSDEMQLVLNHRARKAEEAQEAPGDAESRAFCGESLSKARTTTTPNRKRTGREPTRRVRSGRIQRQNWSPKPLVDKEIIRQIPGLDGKTGKSRVLLRLAGLPFDDVDGFFDVPGPSSVGLDLGGPKSEAETDREEAEADFLAGTSVWRPMPQVCITALMDDGIREKKMREAEEAAATEAAAKEAAADVEGGDKQATPQQEQGSKQQEQQAEDAVPSPQTPKTQRWGLGSLTSSISRVFSNAFHGHNGESATATRAPASAPAASRATDPEPASLSRDRDEDQMIPGRLSLHQPPAPGRRGADQRLALAAQAKSRQSGRERDESASDKADDRVPTGSKRKKRTYRMDKPHTFGIPEEVFDSSSSDEEYPAAGMGQAKGQASPLAEKPNERLIARARRPTTRSSSKEVVPVPQRVRTHKSVRIGDTVFHFVKHEPRRDAQPTKSSLAQRAPHTGSKTRGQTTPKKVIMKRWYSPPAGASFGLSDRVLDESDSDIEVELNEQGLVPDAVPGVARSDIVKMNEKLRDAASRRGKPVVPMTTTGGSHWTQPPPPRPTPGHASLPTSPPTITIDNVALARARSHAEKYKPRQPSGLRRSSSSNNSALANSTNEKTVNDDSMTGVGIIDRESAELVNSSVVDGSADKQMAIDQETSGFEFTSVDNHMFEYGMDVLHVGRLGSRSHVKNGSGKTDALRSSVTEPIVREEGDEHKATHQGRLGYRVASANDEMADYNMDFISTAKFAIGGV